MGISIPTVKKTKRNESHFVIHTEENNRRSPNGIAKGATQKNLRRHWLGELEGEK